MNNQAASFGWSASVTPSTQPLVYYGNGYVPLTIASANGSPSPAPPAKPEPKQSLWDRILSTLRGDDPDLAAKIAAMPRIAGAAPGAETTRKDELTHRKKIILERNVGATHKDVKNGAPSHDGTLELVRTLSGNKNEVGTIGVKATGGVGSYVEIPIEELLAAVEDLRDAAPPA